MKIDIQGFIGKIPLAAEHLLPENAATEAQNCQIRRGLLEPLAGLTTVATPSKVGTTLSLYKFGDFWFNWLRDVDCVQGAVPGDTSSKTYFTGDGEPKMTEAAIATTGSDYPTSSYLLGIPAPVSAPTAVLAGTLSPDPAEDGTEEDRIYVYTYVSAYGEEGPPSDPSTSITWGPGQTVDLTTLGVPTGNYNITKKRIYRSLTTSDGTFFYLLTEQSVGTTAYNDDVNSDSLATTLATTEWVMPPTDLFGLCSMPGGIMAGFSGKNVCFCEPYQPHAWPIAYRLTVDDDIVGGGVFGNSLLVTTENHTYVVTGSEPGSMIIERLEISQSCMSKRGMADMGDGIVYPSPDGLMIVGVGGIENLTRKLLTRDQWNDYSPATLNGFAHDGRYYGFYDDSAGFILDLTTGSLIDLDFYATAGYSDPLTDTLYLVVEDEIVSYGTGENLTAVWKSKTFLADKPLHIGVGQVIARRYPVRVEFFIDEISRKVINVMNDTPFFFPPGVLGRKFAAKITTTNIVERVSVAQNAGELR